MSEIDDLRGLNDVDLSEDLAATHRELMNLRFQSATMQLSDVTAIRKSRKRVARVKTIIRERELARVTQ